MNKPKKTFLFVIMGILIVGIAVVGGMFLGGKDNSVNLSDDAKKVVRDNISISIDDVEDPHANTTTANVTITAPDLVAIYKKYTEDNPEKELSVEDVCSVVAKYANDPDCKVQHNTITEVRKEGNNWVLVSDECIQVVITDIAGQLYAQRINEEESLEIETIDIGRITE